VLYRRLHVLLRREKKEDGTMRWPGNHKRVYRLYREEGLAMRRKAKKRLRSEGRTPLDLATQANQVQDDGFHARQHGQWQKIPHPEPDGRL
jgi:putative transposase